MVEDGPLAPTSLSLFFVFGSFFLAGILHPQEIGCLPYLLIYYITIPAMYLLLVIFSLFNLNNVSWGTRYAVNTCFRRFPSHTHCGTNIKALCQDKSLNLFFNLSNKVKLNFWLLNKHKMEFLYRK